MRELADGSRPDLEAAVRRVLLIGMVKERIRPVWNLSRWLVRRFLLGKRQREDVKSSR